MDKFVTRGKAKVSENSNSIGTKTLTLFEASNSTHVEQEQIIEVTTKVRSDDTTGNTSRSSKLL